ncbi:MAG TPA: lactate racemase domain-containing protein [Kofleriaceae bacterium]|jgi:nickel-dependent lactate racemase
MEVELPYGRAPLRLVGDARHIDVLQAPDLPTPRDIATLVDEALESPIGSPRLRELVRAGGRVAIIVSDSTRREPRAAFLAALRRELPDVKLTVAVATGTHGPCSLGALELPPALLGDATIVMHDGHSDDDLVELGTTSRGTPVRVHRVVVEADLVVATGCIRPHYFAGFGAGIKAIFPGLGQAAAIRVNHRLKTEPAARAGIVDGNPCRDDLDEAVRLVRTPAFLLNGVCGPDSRVHAVVAGDLREAFGRGVELARPWFTVRARPAPMVIASDALPVSASLYQAAKIAAAVAPLVEPGGELVLAAECSDGVAPLDVVNEAIFRIGVLPRLPPDARLSLVSSLGPDVVARTLVGYRSQLPSLEGPTLIVPRASQLICEVI